MARPCGCNPEPTQYAYVDQEGQRTVVSTEVQALAMKIRNDNQGEVVPVK